MENLAENSRVPAVLLEELGQGHDLGQAIPEQRAVVDDAGLVGP
jgi:hypothetical protein